MTNPVPDLTPPAPPVRTYISIPTRITAMQWTGTNIQELWDWITAEFLYGPIPAGDRRAPIPARLYVAANNAWVDIEPGEWILQDTLGFYPCKDSVFRAKYREAPVEDQLAALKEQMGYGPRAPRVIWQGEDTRG